MGGCSPSPPLLQSAVFPWYGCEVIGKLIPACHTTFFESANHWCYLEASCARAGCCCGQWAHGALPPTRRWAPSSSPCLQEPEKFNKLVADFATSGFLNVSKVLHL